MEALECCQLRTAVALSYATPCSACPRDSVYVKTRVLQCVAAAEGGRPVEVGILCAEASAHQKL